MGRTTELTIATLPVVACLALLVGSNLLSGRTAPPGPVSVVPGLEAPVPPAAGRSTPSPMQPAPLLPAPTLQVPTTRQVATPPSPATRPVVSVRTTEAAPVTVRPLRRMPSGRAAPAAPVPTATLRPVAPRPPAVASSRRPPALRRSTPTPKLLARTVPPSRPPGAAPGKAVGVVTRRPGGRVTAPVPVRASPPAPSVGPGPAGTLAAGRRLAELLARPQLTPVWQRFRPATRRAWISLPAFRAYRARRLALYGREQQVLTEEVRHYRNVSYYLRTATYQRGPTQAWTLILGLDASGQVVSFGVVAARTLQARTASR